MGVSAAGGAVRVRARVFLNTEFTEGADEKGGEAWSVEESRGFVERNIGNGSRVWRIVN